MRRRGQLQTLEPIIVVIFIVLLLLVGGAYYLRVFDQNTDAQTDSIQARNDLALLARVASLPELSCTSPRSTSSVCIDLAKAESFSALIANNDTLRVAYFPLLGATNLTLRVVPIEGVAQNVLLYDASRNSTRIRAVRTYVSVHDPRTSLTTIGVLEVRRSVG